MIEQNSPSNCLQRIGQAVARYIGWQVQVEQPPPQKCVIIGAYHTSSSDLWFTLLAMAALGMKVHWVGKDTLFRAPLGGIFRGLGGIPVNRRQSTDFVERMTFLFRKKDVFRLAIMPEGTRRKVDYWKTGFYYIALAAQVPVVMGFVDYKRKVIGLGPSFNPSGDLQADLQLIREFYANITGRFPDRQGEIRIRE